MDEHAKAIHELCSKYYHDNLSGSIRDEIINHLIRTEQPETATEEIVNRLTVESRIEILADLIVLADLMNKRIITPEKQVIMSLIVFRQSDRILGAFVENRLTEEQKRKLIEIFAYELNFVNKSMEETPSFEETEKQIKRLNDKTVYSYRNLLELTIGGRQAKMAGNLELVGLFERMKTLIKNTINSFKLYRS